MENSKRSLDDILAAVHEVVAAEWDKSLKPNSDELTKSMYHSPVKSAGLSYQSTTSYLSILDARKSN